MTLLEEHIPNVVQALFAAGDRLLLPEDERQHMYDPSDNAIRIGWIIWPLLRRLPEDHRFEILRSACLKSDSVSLIVDKIWYLARQHGKYTSQSPVPEDERLLTREHVQELERVALDKIHAAQEAGVLLGTPYLPVVLRRWRDWANEEEVAAWARQAVSSDEGLLKYLTHYFQKTLHHVIGDRVSRTQYRLDPKSLEPFISPEDIIERARKLSARQDIDERERKAVTRFVLEYDRRRTGQDPDDTFDG